MILAFTSDLTFKHHITEMTTNATNFALWLLRTFCTRNKDVMLLLLKTFIIPRVEYCSAVWHPHQINQIEQIEAVQRSFTSKIENLQELNYYQRLQHLNLYSLQRRRERFIIIHTYKIYKNLAPNDLNLIFHENQRLGTQAKRLPLKSKTEKIKTIRFNFFSHSAPRLFNLIPAKIKSAKTVEQFKNRLDKMLRQIPDYPPITGYKRENSNSLTEWVSYIKLAKIQDQRSTDGDQSQTNEDEEAHCGSCRR